MKYSENEEWKDPILDDMVERQDDCSYYDLYDILAVFSTALGTLLVNISSTFLETDETQHSHEWKYSLAVH